MKRTKTPRKNATYRFARRNAVLHPDPLPDGTRQKPGVWEGVAARYVGYDPAPSKTYKPNGERECARRRAQMGFAS